MGNLLSYQNFRETQLSLGLGSRPVEDKRHVNIQDHAANEQYEYRSNHVRTTKYNLVTFLPRSLYEQFTRLGNVYFTLVAVLSTTDLSPVSPITCILPLAMVIGISLIKEAVEDHHRAKLDRQVNHSLILVYREGKFVSVKWEFVRVGEIVKVLRNSNLPADLLFVWSANDGGVCHVETMNLDGETNLKIKDSMGLADTEEQALSMAGELVCDPPNNAIYSFSGNLQLKTGELYPVEDRNILLRGSSLRNTEAVLGVVVYTGHNTKVMMNGTTPPTKRSTVERQIDDVILFMFLLLFAMCGFGAFLTAVWTHNLGDGMWYLMPWDTVPFFSADQPLVVAMGHFITTFILYGFLIPISLYVSIEMVKLCQVFFIGRDLEMYYAPLSMRAQCRTSNLNEELGMVDTVLSDKTGTLTRNQMELFKVSIAGVAYGQGMTEVERSAMRRSGRVPPPEVEAPVKFFNVNDMRLAPSRRHREADVATIEDFLKVMAICHTAVPEGEPTEEGISYQAESPDELAFITAARVYGLFVHKRTATEIHVRERTTDGSLKEVVYTILAVLEFSSTRKRMSVVYRVGNGPIRLFCKGADNVIYERLKKQATSDTYALQTDEHLKLFATQGLRTLCLAKRDVSKAEWAAWEPTYQEARRALDGRKEKLAACAATMEKDLELLGATAIEDKLQEGVPQTITALQSAGVNLWVLTGDKTETAINIGAACSLIRDDMLQHLITVPEGTKLEEATEVVQVLLESKLAAINKMGSDTSHALIIDGRALSVVLAKGLTGTFMAVGGRCKAVMCCRVSPLQKAEVTALVQHHGFKTLAIGDGANDVGMIQEADIGVGISGAEGQQAVMASDFAIAQFKYLERLLLHHGRYCYKRMAKMVTFFFYKNILLGVTLFLYDGHTFFSGQQLYNDSHLSGYNIMFVAFPILVVGVWDQDVSPRIAAVYPHLYQQGVRNEYFTVTARAAWMLNGMYQAIVIYFGVTWAFHLNADRPDGRLQEMWAQGTVMYTCMVLVVNRQTSIIQQYWNWVIHLTRWGTIVFWFAFLCAFQYFSPGAAGSAYYLFFDIVADSWYSWVVVLGVTTAALLPDVCFRVLQRTLFPADHMIAQEVEYEQGQIAKREAVAAAGSSGKYGSNAPNGDDDAAPARHEGAFAAEEDFPQMAPKRGRFGWLPFLGRRTPRTEPEDEMATPAERAPLTSS